VLRRVNVKQKLKRE